MFKTALVDIKWIWYHHMSVNEYKVYMHFDCPSNIQQQRGSSYWLLMDTLLWSVSAFTHLSTPFIQHISHEMLKVLVYIHVSELHYALLDIIWELYSELQDTVIFKESHYFFWSTHVFNFMSL